MTLKKFQDFTGGLNVNQSSTLEDNQFVTLKNMFYNKNKQLQSRRGYRKFGNQIGADPITSFFSHQRDDNLENITLCASGGAMYAYNGTTRSSIDSNLMEYETIPGRTTERTRWDFAVYKNVVYMCDGVNPYCSYDGSTFTRISTSSIGTTTADSGTDELTKATHGMSDGDEVYFTTTGDMPGGLTEYQVYYVVSSATNTFQVSSTLGGTPIDLTSNGTGTLTTIKLTEPRCRYIEYLADSLYGAGDDANPTTLYYTNTLPTDGTNINQNVVVVGGDEEGRINAIAEYSQIILVIKGNKIFAFDPSGPSTDPVDTESGGYANRSLAIVANSLVYMQDQAIDTLVKRDGVTGAGALEAESMSDNVRAILENIESKQYNSACGIFIPENSNYYIAVDTNDDNRPDTVLVYNARVQAWSEYVMPPIYDFGKYINSSQEKQYLFASASGGQMFEFEYGFDDDGASIQTELETKPFDFDDPSLLKVFDFVDITGYKQEGGTLNVTLKVEGDEVGTAEITDSNISASEPAGILAVSPLGTETLGGEGTEGIPMYRFTIRIPFYTRGKNIAIKVEADGVQRIWEKLTISVNGEAVTIFEYNNII